MLHPGFGMGLVVDGTEAWGRIIARKGVFAQGLVVQLKVRLLSLWSSSAHLYCKGSACRFISEPRPQSYHEVLRLASLVSIDIHHSGFRAQGPATIPVHFDLDKTLEEQTYHQSEDVFARPQLLRRFRNWLLSTFVLSIRLDRTLSSFEEGTGFNPLSILT